MAPLVHDPAAVLRRVHTALDEGQFNRFCTGVYGRLELEDGHAKIELANGGHRAPLILRASGRIDAVEQHGPLLGLLRDELDFP